MYAIIATGGKQYKVAEGDVIRVEKLGVEAGETVTFDSVKEGQYKYYVADFSNCSSGNEDSYEMSRSHAVVRVYGKDGLIQTFYVPANRSGVLWEVFEIRDGTIVPLQRYYDVIGDKTWWSSGK